MGSSISPRISFTFQSAAGRLLPLRFARQAPARPIAIGLRSIPAHPNHLMVFITRNNFPCIRFLFRIRVLIRIRQPFHAAFLLVAFTVQKACVHHIRHLGHIHPERVQDTRCGLASRRHRHFRSPSGIRPPGCKPSPSHPPAKSRCRPGWRSQVDWRGVFCRERTRFGWQLRCFGYRIGKKYLSDFYKEKR